MPPSPTTGPAGPSGQADGRRAAEARSKPMSEDELTAAHGYRVNIIPDADEWFIAEIPAYRRSSLTATRR